MLCRNGGKCQGADYIFSCRCPGHVKGVHCETSTFHLVFSLNPFELLQMELSSINKVLMCSLLLSCAVKH